MKNNRQHCRELNKKHYLITIISAILIFLQVLSCTVYGANELDPVRDYDNSVFYDILPTDKDFKAIKLLYELGIIDGADGNLKVEDDMSFVSALVMLSKIHSKLNGVDESFQYETYWYDGYITYAKDNGIARNLPSDLTQTVNISQFVSMLCKAFPYAELPSINLVEDGAIRYIKSPQYNYDEFYSLYRAGVLSNSDFDGSLSVITTVSKRLAIRMIARMLDSSQRLTFTLKNPPYGLYGGIVFVLLGIFFVDELYVGSLINKYSQKIDDVQKINASTTFGCIDTRKKYTINLTSKQKFDRFDSDEYAMLCLLEDQSYWVEGIKVLSANRVKFDRYMNQLSPFLKETTIDEYLQAVHAPRLFYQHFCNKEKRRLHRLIISPVLDCDLLLTKDYTSPKGRNHYSQTYTYKYEGIIQLLRMIDMREQRKASAEYQRAIMTDKLRYAVMKRDGFRCTLCGRGREDGVKLHVDHIKPVSKGGRTELNNLRTLCEQCNLGKSDSYDEYGLN